MSTRRRTVTIPGIGRLEFGPWWWKLWHRLRHGGHWHHVITGESCVLHLESEDAHP